ncbi:hypothetical protein QN277_024024 [Acacia crassicarpa]|uniref:Uncharacterized protein n=1 Tax=Acacia crassicarpa TaxID=499986 RepID=A0AAE1JED0_9FABA|nr:hypothetical protein QN277_024024 [Acacia crassicarpa]
MFVSRCHCMYHVNECPLLFSRSGGCLKPPIDGERLSMSPKDNYCIEAVLRCLALAGDGLGPHELNDGGYSQRHYGCWFQRYMVDVWWDYLAEKSCSLLSVIVERNVKVMVNFDEMNW